MAAWGVAPGVTGIVSAIFYILVRTFILRKEDSFRRTQTFFPLIVGITKFVVSFLVMNKAGSGKGWNKTIGDWGMVGIAAGCGVVAAIIVRIIFVPKMRANLENVTDDSVAFVDDAEKGDEEVEVAKGGNAFMRMMNAKNEKLHTITDKRTQAVHDNAEKFELRTELAFGYIQVFTACAMSFAHGSNDAANAVGPLASIVGLYNSNGIVSSKAPVDIWILAMGGAGIVVGLGTLGYKVMKALGVNLVKMTAARGSCIELASAFVVCFGSYAKLPLSTTQVMVGGSLGVGLIDGGNKGVNMFFLAKIFLGWMFTFIVAGSISGALFSLVFYAPSVSLPLAQQTCLGNFGETNAITNLTTVVGNFTNGALF